VNSVISKLDLRKLVVMKPYGKKKEKGPGTECPRKRRTSSGKTVLLNAVENLVSWRGKNQSGRWRSRSWYSCNSRKTNDNRGALSPLASVKGIGKYEKKGGTVKVLGLLGKTQY